MLKRGRGQPRIDPGDETVELHVRVPKRLRDRVDEAAAREGVGRSEVVRDALERHVGGPVPADG